MRAAILIAVAGFVGVAHVAQAQSRPLPNRRRAPGLERIRVSLNGIEQVTTQTLSQNFTVTKNLEKTPIAADIDLPILPLFDVGGSLRLINRLAVGVAVSLLEHNLGGTVEAKIPHPLYFNASRTVTGELSSLRQTETAVHVAAMYFIPRGRLDIGVFGGPSRFDVKQELITDVIYTESYPFDNASFESAPTASVSKTVRGYNVGADVTWRLSRRLGVGGLVRFASASTTLSVSSGNEVDTDVGGLQMGVGLRLIF